MYLYLIEEMKWRTPSADDTICIDTFPGLNPMFIYTCQLSNIIDLIY